MAKTEISRTGYKILKEKRLVIDVLSGNLNLEIFKSHKLTQSLDVDFSKDYNSFVDIRSVIVTGMLEDVDVYVDFVLKMGAWVGENRRTAVLVTTPNQTIFAKQFVELKKKLPQDIDIFTEIADAVKWVTDELTVDEIEKVLEDIKRDSFIHYSDTDY